MDPEPRFSPEADAALKAHYALFGNDQTPAQKLHILELDLGESILHMEPGPAHDETKLAATEYQWLCAKGILELDLV